MKIISAKGNIRKFKFGDKLRRVKPSTSGFIKFEKEIETILFRKIENDKIYIKYFYEYTKGSVMFYIDLEEWEDGWVKVK